MDPNALLNKILRLARLDTTVFDEVRDDQNELIPATIVTVVSAMLAGLGAMLFYMVNSVFGSEDPDGLFLRTFLMGGIFLGMLYLGWILIAYVVIVQVFKASADLQSLMRTMGYAALPLSLSAAHVHVVGLARGLSGYVVPSRLYGVLAVGRPVLVGADEDSETARLVESIGCGVVVPPGRPDLLAAAIRELHGGSLDLEALGRRGREYAEAEADRSVAVARYRELLRELVGR